MNKTIKKYINQLPIIGAVYFIIGIILLLILLSANFTYAIGYIPITAIGIVIGYLLIVRGDPGGNVNFYLNTHKKTQDEQYLYNLVVKNRNIILINLVMVGVLIIFSILDISKSSSTVHVNFSDSTWWIIMIFITVLMIGNGTKYLSAWWNIKRNIKNGNL